MVLKYMLPTRNRCRCFHNSLMQYLFLGFLPAEDRLLTRFPNVFSFLPPAQTNSYMDIKCKGTLASTIFRSFLLQFAWAAWVSYCNASPWGHPTSRVSRKYPFSEEKKILICIIIAFVALTNDICKWLLSLIIVLGARSIYHTQMFI